MLNGGLDALIKKHAISKDEVHKIRIIMNLPANILNEQFSMKMLERSEFKDQKREKQLDFKAYQTNFAEANYTFEIVKQVLEQPTSILTNIPPYNLMVSTKQRAWDAINHLVNCYSAGHDVADLASIYPSIIEYWEVNARFSKNFKEADPGRPSTVAHIGLQGNDFIFANELVSIGILLGWGALLPRILPIIDYNNPIRDGLLERLLHFYVLDRGEPPDDCTRHLPYFKTIKIFNAAKDNRPALLADYLAEWYHASRREPYYESHKKSGSFLGYWAWEAAAVAHVLNIDDASVHNAQFYPMDMASFSTEYVRTAQEDASHFSSELRAKAGEACPKTGVWASLEIPVRTASVKQGEIMGGSHSPYGFTVWIYKGDN